ncbi:hypothetical protein GIB67_028291 [Kingdonia uniflora]|uniref:RRM domain-containing protein n=1 Tax=Kingdonia uniflora TaxID=39325 RepID=A0A7J7MHK3_9MAGN|nr:hypothetical protein GIB67_028291 [Kingdonia uniflora]
MHTESPMSQAFDSVAETEVPEPVTVNGTFKEQTSTPPHAPENITETKFLLPLPPDRMITLEEPHQVIKVLRDLFKVEKKLNQLKQMMNIKPAYSSSQMMQMINLLITRTNKDGGYQIGLSFYRSEKTLRVAFEGFGELIEVKIIMDKISKMPKGYAFLEYTTEEVAGAALKDMNDKIINQRMIVVDVAKTNPPKYNKDSMKKPIV